MNEALNCCLKLRSKLSPIDGWCHDSLYQIAVLFITPLNVVSCYFCLTHFGDSSH